VRIANQEDGLGIHFANNILSENSAYGLHYDQGSTDRDIFVNEGNAYYNNTTAARNNVTAGQGDVTLTADPYTDEASDDYTYNSTAGGGAALKDVRVPSTIP
jgi:hypothetical protein